MEISLPVAERTTTKTITKYATDSSVSITADYSSRRDQVSSVSGGSTDSMNISNEYTTTAGTITVAAGQTAGGYYSYSLPATLTAVTVTDCWILEDSSAVILAGWEPYPNNQVIVQIGNTGTKTETVTIMVTVQTNEYFQTTLATFSTAHVPTGNSNYTLDYCYSSTGSADYSLSSDGQRITVTNWIGDSNASEILLTYTISWTERYITGYSGYASVNIDDTDPYDIEVDSVTSGVTSYSSPYYSSGNIRCTLYADNSMTASVTFSYKVDSTVTEKYFNINVNGEDIEEVNFNDVDLDPNA